MSKTTPEEAKVLALKHGGIDLTDVAGAIPLRFQSFKQLAALIDEARGVDAEPVAIGWAWKWPDGILPEGHPRAGWQFERDDPRKEMHPSNIGFIEVVQIYAPKISGLSTQVPVSMAAHIGEREYATHPAPSQPIDKVVVTKNDKGQIVAVTRQNEEGQILSIISESAPSQPTAPVELPVVAVNKEWATKDMSILIHCLRTTTNFDATLIGEMLEYAKQAAIAAGRKAS